MSATIVNEVDSICPCGRRVDTDAFGMVSPHRPGRTSGMQNMFNRKARKAAWCDITKREEAAVEYVRSGKKLADDTRIAIDIAEAPRTPAEWLVIDRKLMLARNEIVLDMEAEVIS